LQDQNGSPINQQKKEIFNFIWFFPKKKILILNLEEKNVAGQERKKNIPT
jgi:hypothetical protein